MTSLLQKIIATISIPFSMVAGLIGINNAAPAPQPAPVAVEQKQAPAPAISVEEQRQILDLQRRIAELKTQIEEAKKAQANGKLGATFQLPTATALFEDSIASNIGKTDTSMTLVRGTDINGVSLASSTYGFILDQGTANQELVLADCTGTTCTNISRGVDPVTGTTTVTALEHAHRSGASVKQTDAPVLVHLVRVAQGKGNFENVLHYATTTPACSLGTDICNKTYVDALSFTGAPDASPTQKGVVEVASGAEAASSKQNGTGDTSAYLGLTSNISTSTPYTAGNYVAVTKSTGFLDPQIIGTSTVAAPNGYRFASTTCTLNCTLNSATTTIGSATTTIPSGAALFSIGTTTPGGIASGTVIAKSLYVAGGAGFGVATSAPGTVEISGNLQVNGTCSGCGGSKLLATAKNTDVSSGALNTQVFSFTVPANSLSTGNIIEVTGFYVGTSTAGGQTVTIGSNYGGYALATTSAKLFQDSNNAGSGSYGGRFDFMLLGNGATNAQYSTASIYGANASTTMFRTVLAADSTIDQTLNVVVTLGANVSVTVESVYAKLFK